MRPYAAAKEATRKARERYAVAGDITAVNRAFAELSRKAKQLGMTVDHVVPIAGCRVCGARGLHEQSNWQLLTAAANSSKGARCQECWL
jgi:hypothetical protein